MLMGLAPPPQWWKSFPTIKPVIQPHNRFCVDQGTKLDTIWNFVVQWVKSDTSAVIYLRFVLPAGMDDDDAVGDLDSMPNQQCCGIQQCIIHLIADLRARLSLVCDLDVEVLTWGVPAGHVEMRVCFA